MNQKTKKASKKEGTNWQKQETEILERYSNRYYDCSSWSCNSTVFRD